MPRFSSTTIWVQTLTPDRFFQLSPSQLSWPISPGCGTVWKVQTSLPLRAS